MSAKHSGDTILSVANITPQKELQYRNTVKPHQFNMLSPESMRKAYRILYESHDKKKGR